jgi:hypothetical protein
MRRILNGLLSGSIIWFTCTTAQARQLSQRDVQRILATQKLAERYLVIDPVVVVSQECVVDFLKIRTNQELNQREQILELVDKGCARQMPGLFYVSTVPGGKLYNGFVPATSVMLDVERMQLMYPKLLNKLLEQERNKAVTDPSVTGVMADVYIDLDDCRIEGFFDKTVAGRKSKESPLKNNVKESTYASL